MSSWTRNHDAAIAENAERKTVTKVLCPLVGQPDIEVYRASGRTLPSYPSSLTACLRAISNWQKQDADNRWWILESPRPGQPGSQYLCDLRAGNGGVDASGEGETLAEAMAWALYVAVTW